MFNWLKANKDAAEEPERIFSSITDGLKKLYKSRIRPVEELHRFGEFHSPLLTDSDFDAKPTVLLLGQYSTGKTTFIRHLLGRDFPGMHIGPEPTTDRFCAIMHGQDDRVIPGNALAVQRDKPFTALTKFGTSFLSKFQASQMDSPILRNITLIDTPGVLAGDKQKIGRNYDFVGVIEWFAQRADLILLLFDAHKLDISDEFRMTIDALAGHDDKVRVVLNKADMVSGQQLMRVYGAMMWSLGKVIRTPEVMRVYIGSFWDKPYQCKDNEALFEAERQDLFKDLMSLPRNSAVRKINELVKRARLAKVHAFITSHLRNEMPYFGRAAKQEALIKDLITEFRKVQRQYHLPPGDFPDCVRFQENLRDFDISKFPKLDPKKLEQMDYVLGVELPKLMERFPVEGSTSDLTSGVSFTWEITAEQKNTYGEVFWSLPLENAKAKGNTVRDVLARSELPFDVLAHVWRLSDIDKDGYLDESEFCIAMFLCDAKKNGTDLPEVLPDSMIPPNKQISAMGQDFSSAQS